MPTAFQTVRVTSPPKSSESVTKAGTAPVICTGSESTDNSPSDGATTTQVCYEDTPFIMMEYMGKGDLNQYLQKFTTLSTTDSEPQGQITISTLVHMTTQIASAMKYFASHNYVHRDLATRNCLVGPNYLVKISDFGMSRSLYDSHYYRIHGYFVLPVRWMAFECFYGKFSQKSDVCAFGVTMWEIFALAKEQPYNDMSDQQVVENALKGKNRTLLT